MCYLLGYFIFFIAIPRLRMRIHTSKLNQILSMVPMCAPTCSIDLTEMFHFVLLALRF